MNIKDHPELQIEKKYLERWLPAAKEAATEGKDLCLLRVEALQQRVRTDHLSQPALSFKSSRLPPSRLLKESRKLQEHHHNFHINIIGGSKETQRSRNKDVEVFRALSKSTLDWIGDLRQTVNSSLTGSPDIFSSVEQRLHNAQALSGVRSEVDARLEELRVIAAHVSSELLAEEEVKLEVQEIIQRAEEQWSELWEPLEPYHRALQADPRLSSSYLPQRREACSRVKELQHRAAHIPTVFPRPATDQRTLTSLLAHSLWEECETLRLTLASLAEQKRELREESSSAVWTDSSWEELHKCWSALMEELKGICSCLEEGVKNEEQINLLLQGCTNRLTSLQRRWTAWDMQRAAGITRDRTAVEALLQEVTNMDQDVSQLLTLKDTITFSSAMKSHSSLAQQVSRLQNHKSVLERSIRESLAEVKTNPNIHQVEEEVWSLQRDLTALQEIFGNLSETHKVSPDFKQLKQEWCTIQGLDAQLSEMSTRANRLQRAREETLPPDVSLAINGVFKELDSLRSVCLRKRKECENSTVSSVREAISHMQRWSQSDESSSPSKAVLDQGLQLQQSLSELLSERSFLLGCLGAEVTEKLESCASRALFESQPVFQSLPQSKMAVKAASDDSNTPQSCPDMSEKQNPATASCTSTDDGTKQRHECISMQKAEISIISSADSPKEEDGKDAHILFSASPDVTNSKKQQSPSLLTSTTAGTSLYYSLQSRKQKVPKENITYSPVSAPKTSSEPLHRQNFYAWVSQLCDITPETCTYTSSPHSITSVNGSNPGLLMETQTVDVHSGAQDKKREFGDTGTSTKKVFTIMLDVEPQVRRFEVCDPKQSKPAAHAEHCQHQSQSGTDSQEQQGQTEDASTPTIHLDLEPVNILQRDNSGSCSPDVGRCFKEEHSGDDCGNTNVDDKSKSGSDSQQDLDVPDTSFGKFTEVFNPTECKDASYKVPTVVSNMKLQPHNSQKAQSVKCQEKLVPTEQECQHVCSNMPPEQCSSANISRKEIHKTQEVRERDKLTSIKSHSDAECLLNSARAAETRGEETTDVCHTGEQTASSLLCSERDSEQSGDAFSGTVMTTAAAHSEQVTASDRKKSSSTAVCGNGENTKSSAGIGTNHVSQRETNISPPERKSEGTLGDTAVTLEQIQSQESRIFPVVTSLGGTTGGSAESCKQTSTMQGILAEIQSSVKKRTADMDLHWYLKSSPGEAEIGLLRTVQQILACRYQPAQLSVTLMAKQLEEAEEYQHYVHEQVATMKGQSGESQWRTALLDASATAQVKTAQLNLVTLYHRKMKMARVFLKVVAAEKEKLNLNALESSALHAESLNALLQTLKRKKSIMGDLIHISSQLSVYLCGVEGSGTLLAQLGDIQEEWQLLERRVERELRHASSTIFQSVLLQQEAEQLKDKLEGLQISNCQSFDSKSALELVYLSTDLKLYHQVYLHLQSQFDALLHFCLGQKEKDEITLYLQGVKSILNDTTTKLNCFTNESNVSTKISKQLKDLVIWAKQVEIHICVGERLALFPEEARIQIDEMKMFEADVLSKRSKMQLQIEEIKKATSDMEKVESDHIMKTVEDLYNGLAPSLNHVLDTMGKNLNEREKLFCEFASIEAWLAETHAKKDSSNHIGNVSMAESQLQSNKLAIIEIENQQKLLEALSERCKSISTGLIPGESRYLVNKLSEFSAELDELLAHEKVTSWELEDFIHKVTTSNEELLAIEASLKNISTDLEQQRFPLTQETFSQAARFQHMLTEHEFEVRDLQQCPEAKRSSLMSLIKELQDGCRSLIISAFEHERYLHLKRWIEESRTITEGRIQQARNKAISVGERFRQCQTLLVELPLMKTQCQEAADQLESIAQDLTASELESEKENIQQTVEALVCWEHSTTDEIKSLESKLLLGLRFDSEFSAFMEFLKSTREDLEKAKPVSPEEEDIDLALKQCWVIWRNLESWMRVLQGLGRKEKVQLWKHKDLYSLKDALMQECHKQMVSLSEARESLKDYQWAAQGAISFLRNAEATILHASGGCLDFTEEQLHIRQTLEALRDGFQAHFSNVVQRVPRQSSLSHAKVEQLHISVLSQLQVGRALLEAQAQLRLDSLQRCETREQYYRKSRKDVSQQLSEFEAQLSDFTLEEVTSHDQSVSQQSRAKQLVDHLHNLNGMMDDLRMGCLRQSCGAGNNGELGGIWHCWVSLRQAVGLLIVRSEQREEEWKDVTESMEQCCSCLARLEAKVPDLSTICFIQNKPQELLAQAELHQAGLEQEQQTLASIKRRLEHALTLSKSSHPISPGPLARTLLKMQEKITRLKERNMLVVAAAQAEEKEREQTQDEAVQIENHVTDILQELENCSNPNKRQELMKDLLSQKTRLQCNKEKLLSRYGEIPTESRRMMQQVELSLQTAEEKLLEENGILGKVSGRVKELSSGLDRVMASLDKKSPTVPEAQNVLKHVWDELDKWHSSLMLLESEVQDLAQEQPNHGQLLIDQLTQPLQLYQNAAQRAEQRTAFLNRIPTCLQELEDILCSATCWLDEAKLWLSNPCSFTTAKSIQNHAKSLQLVLDDSERLKHNLDSFRMVLGDISQVCDVSTQERRLDRMDQQVQKMRCSILEPLEQLLQGASMMEEVEAELKTIERNISKVQTILSLWENSNIPVTEHLTNREVILANVLSMRRTLEEIERCKDDPHVPARAKQSLLVFSRARQFLQQLEQVEKVTLEQVSELKTKIEYGETNTCDGATRVSQQETQPLDDSLHRVQETHSEEEEDEESKSYRSSSSDTLTCSVSEDLEDVFSNEDLSEINPDAECLDSSIQPFSSVMEEKNEGDDATFPSVKSKFDTSCEFKPGLNELDSEAFAPELLRPVSSTTHALPAADHLLKAAQKDQEPPNQDKRRPGTGSAAVNEIAEEEIKNLLLTAPSQYLLISSPLCLLHEFELEQSEIFSHLKDAPSLERVLGRDLRESPGETSRLQQASQSLLQGMARLVAMGEGCMRERQSSHFQTLSNLQAILCRDQKLMCVLHSQLVFVQYLFQREPRALECQKDEWVQLEAQVKALQQQALEQDVSAQRWLQEWTDWEDNCSQLGGVLDEWETFISSGTSETDDGEESVKHRINTCQQMLLHLDESRAALGLLLNRGEVLQSELTLSAPFKQTGGVLELRWKHDCMQIQQEVQRCRKVQDSCARFKTDFTLLSEWLIKANTHLRRLSALGDVAEPSQECVRGGLIELLDFSMEVEATSALKTSVFKNATQLLHLREADSPEVRAMLNQAEVDWNQFTSDLSETQARLQQCLLSEQQQGELLSDLHRWLEAVQARLKQEEEQVSKARNAAEILEVLQRFKALKMGVSNGQLLLDFLCQPKPQTVGEDAQARRSEFSAFAEELGTIRLECLELHRAIESQIGAGEQMHHTCANREKKLQHHHIWIDEQRKQLDELKQLSSQSVVRHTLQHWEELVGRGNEVTAAVLELKCAGASEGKVAECSCDVVFSEQAQSFCQAYEELGQQLDAQKPALQQNVDDWTTFHSKLREVAVTTTRARCVSQQHPASFFSPEQAEGYAELLQDLQVMTEKGEKLWTVIEGSFQRLEETLHHKTAEALREEMKAEQKRWKDTIQELKDKQEETAEAMSVWMEYTLVSESCALRLQKLRLQWEELISPLDTPEERTASSVAKLQKSAEELQSIVGGVLKVSKSLIGRLELLPGSVIESETSKLSHDILLLNQTISGKLKNLQDSEEKNAFNTRLELIEVKAKNLSELSYSTAYPMQVLSDLSDLLPSLVEITEMSTHMDLSKMETERLHCVSKEWVESVSSISDILRVVQAERQKSQSFQEKYTCLISIQEKLEQESKSEQPLTSSNLRRRMSDHQRLQAEMNSGHQLLQSLLGDAAQRLAEVTAEERAELVAQVALIKTSWFNAVAAVEQKRLWIKEQLKLWRIYSLGLKFFWKLLRDIDSILPPTGPSICTLHQLHRWADIYQSVERSLALHAPLCDQTLDVGKHLFETTTESQCGLLSELQDLEDAWERTVSLMSRGRNRVGSTMQTWSRCQDGINHIMSDLDVLQLNQSVGRQDTDEALIQENEVFLQHLASGLREVATMKTDLSQYVAASDSALLEQQLEQLHCQWEELCMKVSLRKQEIADRLNAWTIFNDKNKEFCDWLTQMENKVCHRGDLSIEDMVEKLKKDCMEEINLFSENKSHLKQLGEQLLLASAEAKQSQVHGSLQEVNQRWHSLFHHIESRVKKLKETLVTVQQLDKNMSNLRSWLSRIEAELSRPITYSVCNQQEIQKRLAEQQELQRDIEQHTEGVASVLSLCDVLLRDEDAASGPEAESDSLQETSQSLDQRWRTICAMALDRRLRIEETWTLWCKFLNDYSRFEDWLKMAERTAANPNSADVLFTVAKEELKRFEGFQRQVNERLTQLELVNNQYRRLARENRTDRASKLKAMVHEGNRRWDLLHRRVASIIRRLKHFTSQREDFEGTRESLLVWLTELDLQLTNVEHFSESDVHQKIDQLKSFQKEIALNTERIDGLIVFGEGLIQKSSPQDAALIEDELEELHSYCQEVFSRLVRFHQRLSQPTIINESELSGANFSLESSLELIGRPLLGRSFGSLPATPTHLLTSPLERSGRETPVSVDSLPLEWDHTGDVGGSSSHEDDEEAEEDEEEGRYFSALSAPSRSMVSQRWRPAGDTEDSTDASHTLTSTPLKQGYLRLMSKCSGSIENIKRVSLMLDDEEEPEEFGLTGLTSSEKQSGVIARWELLQAQSRHSQDAPHVTSDLIEISSWLEKTIPELDRRQQPEPVASIEEIEASATELKEMQRTFAHYKSVMLSLNLRGEEEAPGLRDVNVSWSRACTGLQRWDTSLRKTLMRCQEFHETLHCLLLWLAHAESRRYAVDISHPHTTARALQQHRHTLTGLQEELRSRQAQQASLQALWSQLLPEEGAEDSEEAQEKLHVTGSRLKLLLKQVEQDLNTVTHRLDNERPSAASPQETHPKKAPSAQRERRDRSFLSRVLRAAFSLQLLLLLLLLLPCMIPMSDSDPDCTVTNNFARSFYPMLRYTNGPPPT
ncbi:nesprin-2a isoform X2 [Gouania willdenowi]|uniref:nesprin-2a isoform X2 n=1 Tax=Gouania willdenowi TaxID=441366 RepID=UPI001055CE79|nr:nesprin-2-like isoform X2 [Gouania willdenowi]